jgi:hypothetical protein
LLFQRILPIQLLLVNDNSIIEAFHLKDFMEKVHTDLMATGGRRDPLQVPVKASFSQIKLGVKLTAPAYRTGRHRAGLPGNVD